ncbi:hypothetical protein HDU98_009435 [Podochytrium sp. JEL0797]|nr:hypothetical protein HDU98_009435 [Podochytrium sp. JEL0797]
MMTTSDFSCYASIGDPQLRGDVEALHLRDSSAAALLLRLVAYFEEAKEGRPTPLEQPQMPLETPLASLKDLSFALPARKRLALAVSNTSIQLLANNTPSLALHTTHIARVLCLPTPNKQKPNYSLLIEVTESAQPLLVDNNIIGNAPVTALMFAFDNQGSIMSIESEIDSLKCTLSKTDDKKDRILNMLSHVLPASIQIEQPNMSLFDLASPNSKLGRANCCWVNGLVKMKDGHLYLLPQTVFFGPKKPLHILPIATIRAISFAFITSRTFTLLIHHRVTPGGELESLEVEMVDKNELESVLAYFKGRGVRVADASEVLELEDAAKSTNNVVVIGTGRVMGDSERVGAVPGEGIDVNGDELDSDEEDEDFVGVCEDADDDLDEEYDSDHQTDDGDTADESNSDSEAEDDDEDSASIGSDGEPLVLESTSLGQDSSRKRKIGGDVLVEAGGNSKRQFVVVEDDGEDSEDDIDELAL